MRSPALHPVKHVDHTLFQHPGPNAAHHVLSREPLQNNGLDPNQMEDLGALEAGRSGADYTELGAGGRH